MPVIQDLFAGKRVLVVTAHPDDESLYFTGGLDALAARANVRILCATYDEGSVRGRELRDVASELGIECRFLGLADEGIDSLLRRLEPALEEGLGRDDIDVLITHPPHGGEKPHPHHVQVFLAAMKAAAARRCSFAFFSEDPESLCAPGTAGLYVLTKSRMLRFLGLQIFRVRRRDVVRAVGLWLRQALSSSVDMRFHRFRVPVSVEEKKRLLKKHVSQAPIVARYRTAELAREFLFVVRTNRRSL